MQAWIFVRIAQKVVQFGEIRKFNIGISKFCGIFKRIDASLRKNYYLYIPEKY